MKTISKITIGLATTALLMIGCGSGSNATPANEATAKPKISEEALSYRNTSLYTEKGTTVPVALYCTDAPGTSKKIKRAFQDAPPMIPHDTDGMLPIKKGNNQCLSCHMPDVASSMGATPIPQSHFLDMRPVNKIVDGKLVKGVDNLQNQVSIKKISDVYPGRFNCSQCHAPQANAKLVTENKFQPQYISKDGAYRSHWNEVVTDDLDTLGKDSSVTAKDVANENSPAGKPLFGH
ncbi:nitrate reductase cytochrome c-type subunit [Sulfurimonas sp. HSL-1716]|uniref:nitrate reductase cytochrome c-type subunit n=1 Tax=Hydrocurvibacter sulfurireducens TaxID=3131937 RepID=UPI0031F85B59